MPTALKFDANTNPDVFGGSGDDMIDELDLQRDPEPQPKGDALQVLAFDDFVFETDDGSLVLDVSNDLASLLLGPVPSHVIGASIESSKDYYVEPGEPAFLEFDLTL